VALALLLSACGAADRPFDRVDLIPSYWEIASVSGAPATGATPPFLAIERSSSARVEMACGEIDYRYVADTDGAALSFAEQRVDAACTTPTDPQDVAIRAAISGVSRWRVTSDTMIDMIDAGGVARLSLRMTTCNCPHAPPGTGAPTSS